MWSRVALCFRQREKDGSVNLLSTNLCKELERTNGGYPVAWVGWADIQGIISIRLTSQYIWSPQDGVGVLESVAVVIDPLERRAHTERSLHVAAAAISLYAQKESDPRGRTVHCLLIRILWERP